ncbi:MAG: hypothetical protein ACLQVF_40540 [Isosphaeraceae bacterium]
MNLATEMVHERNGAARALEQATAAMEAQSAAVMAERESMRAEIAGRVAGARLNGAKGA